MGYMTSCIESLKKLLIFLNPWFITRFNKSKSWRLDKPIMVMILPPLQFKEYKGILTGRNCNPKPSDCYNNMAFIGSFVSNMIGNYNSFNFVAY